MNTRDIHALTGLRGLAALWVFLYHAVLFSRRVGSEAHQPMSLLGGAGFLGVDIFFVLSGFVLAHRYGATGLHSNLCRYASYLWRRLARIYPVHLWGLLLVLILQVGFSLAGIRFISPERLSVEGLLASISLTHAWTIPVERTWNTVSWSISSEWAAYLIFPIIALAAGRISSKSLLLVLLPAIYAGLALQVWNGVHAGTMAYGVQRVVVGFAAGVLLHRLWTLRHQERSVQFDRMTTVALIAMVFGGNLLAAAFGTSVPMAVLPIAACFVVYGLAASVGNVSRTLSSPLPVWAGRVSYSFYMTNYLILSASAVAAKGTGLLTSTVAGLSAIGAIFAICISFAVATYRICEVPARRRMLALIDQRQSVRKAAGEMTQVRIVSGGPSYESSRKIAVRLANTGACLKDNVRRT